MLAVTFSEKQVKTTNSTSIKGDVKLPSKGMKYLLLLLHHEERKKCSYKEIEHQKPNS
jgi:hypothetical protein